MEAYNIIEYHVFKNLFLGLTEQSNKKNYIIYGKLTPPSIEMLHSNERKSATFIANFIDNNTSNLLSIIPINEKQEYKNLIKIFGDLI